MVGQGAPRPERHDPKIQGERTRDYPYPEALLEAVYRHLRTCVGLLAGCAGPRKFANGGT